MPEGTQPVARSPLHAVSAPGTAPVARLSEHEYLGTVTKKTLRAHDGKIGEKYLTDLFKTSFEGDLSAWTRRSLPTMAASVESILVKKTVTTTRIFESLGVPIEQLAFRRQQVALFAEENESAIPRGGNSGAWMMYWEGAELYLAYLYMVGPTQVGMIPFPFGSVHEQILPDHQYHTIVIPERKQ